MMAYDRVLNGLVFRGIKIDKSVGIIAVFDRLSAVSFRLSAFGYYAVLLSLEQFDNHEFSFLLVNYF
jgi:hypothetical protein